MRRVTNQKILELLPLKVYFKKKCMAEFITVSPFNYHFSKEPKKKQILYISHETLFEYQTHIIYYAFINFINYI